MKPALLDLFEHLSEVFPRHLAEKYVRDDKPVMRTGEMRVNVLELVIHTGKATDWYSTTKLAVRIEMGEVFDYVLEHYPQSIDMAKPASIVRLSMSRFERLPQEVRRRQGAYRCLGSRARASGRPRPGEGMP